ncbi:MAG: response regulator [Candidatus Sericytochromatia bacterium]
MSKDHSKVKVLVIDDDNITLIILEKILLKEGFFVESGKSAVDAIKALTEKSFDIVISDIKMPNLSGFDLMIWMKSNKIRSKLIMMSSDVTPSLKKDYEKYGVLQIIAKPFTDEELIENIDFALEENFNANVSNLSMFDLIKILIMSNKDRGIVVKSHISEKNGLIYIKRGEVVFAQYDNILGENAFYNLMSIQNGIITEVDFDEKIQQNISLPFGFLLMESARFIDDTPSETLPENIKILSVDDDPVILKILNEFLSKKNCIVTTTTSPSEALKLLKDNKYNFLISDINMPEFNGFELIDAVIENNIEITPIFITGHGSSEYHDTSINKGALKYLEKPIDLNELYKILTSGIQGSIHQVTLLDYVQLMVNSQVSSLISVASPASDLYGKIYIKNGNIIHAKYNNLVGEEAFNAMAIIQRGVFSQIEWEEPEQISINKTPMKLLINFSNILDTSNNEKEKDLHSQIKEVNQKVEMELIKSAMQMVQDKNKDFLSFGFQFPNSNTTENKYEKDKKNILENEIKKPISNESNSVLEDNSNVNVIQKEFEFIPIKTIKYDETKNEKKSNEKEINKNENIFSNLINTDESPILNFFKKKVVHKDD